MVIAASLLLLAAVTIRQDATLRTGCEPDDAIIATVRAGEPAQIRFALAGSATPCYKVSTSAGTGYVNGNDLGGLDQFETERNRASLITDSIKVTRVEMDTAVRRAAVAVAANGPLAGAIRLLETNQPAAALASLEPELRRARRDPNALTLAGIAAWRNDDSRHALEYLKASLDVQPDPALQNLYLKVQREESGDRSSQRSIGIHITLRYEGATVVPDVAREMVNALDSEYARIADQLGCRAEERITAVVQSRDAYLATTGAAEWTGGQYDGRIRIALLETGSVGAATRRLFAHELVHACLASLGSFPLWFQEGVAQKLSGDQLPLTVARMLATKAREGSLPSLADLGGGWSRMSADNARVAYAMALRAADLLPLDARSLARDRDAVNRLVPELDRKIRELP